MRYQEIAILLPCHSLEDFPVHHEGDEAQGLLAGWSAMWHPAFIAAAGKIPTWMRVEDPPEELGERLLVIPTVSSEQVPTGFVQRARREGACVLHRQLDRGEMVESALSQLDGGAGGVEEDVAADFLALGYCYLQVELLTRQMRYSSNLDELHFSAIVVEAAQAAMQGDAVSTNEKLAACFDLLAEERDHYYSVDAFVLDLTLVARTTVGEAFRDQFNAACPVNVMLSGEVLTHMAAQQPESLRSLREALDASRCGLIGGEEFERPLPLLPSEAVLGELQRGMEVFQQHLGRTPRVYGRHRFGLTAGLPQVLARLGFAGACHATFEDGRVPEGSQVKLRWEGSDGSSIDAIGKAPLDASRPETFLNLAARLGESMDTDHVATLVLAHWPGRASPWLADLHRISRFGNMLGRFVTVDEYFNDTDVSGYLERFEADQYRSPYLQQAVIGRRPDPISSAVRYWRSRAIATASESLDTLASLIQSDLEGTTQPLGPQLDQVVDDVRPLEETTRTAHCTALQRFSHSVTGDESGAGGGCLVANPSGMVRRIGIRSAHFQGVPPGDKAVYAAAVSGDETQVVVDVPPMGYVWLPTAGETRQQPARRRAETVAIDTRDKDGVIALRNEFFEVLVNPRTGSLQSIHDYASRGNQLSQQLAYRLPGQRRPAGAAWMDPVESAVYSSMIADEVTVTASSEVFGEITARGSLVAPDGRRLAGFSQWYRLWRGGRVVELEMELEPEEEPRADPWGSYYCARFAWPDEGADLYRTVNDVRHKSEAARFESPQLIEIDNGERRVALLTAGLPYHRRHGLRMLDSLLITRGETARRFRMGIGVDLPHAIHAATTFQVPEMVAWTGAPPSAGDTAAWLFQLDNRNVLPTSWSPWVEEGQIVGFRVRLLETAGRPARVQVKSFRDVAIARQVDFCNQGLGDCRLENGAICLQLTGHEWAELEARWDSGRPLADADSAS
ncbi:MAG: hypothetical protein VX346_21555 [Planctomycetota bacterium]|nr:hypothetical protein [Planctomycetota bacterium]